MEFEIKCIDRRSRSRGSSSLPSFIDCNSEYICPVCVNDISSAAKCGNAYYTTCKHVFCISCVLQLKTFYGCSFKCPVCRTQLDLYLNDERIKLPPFSSINLPENAEFDDPMLTSAYNVITKHQKWKALYNYKFEENDGFMYCHDKDVKNIMKLIQDEYGLHSGMSMAFTMHQMYFLACFGYDTYKTISSISVF